MCTLLHTHTHTRTHARTHTRTHSQLPVISDLRNPTLKPRHWVVIEDIVQHKFDPETTLTLQLLTDLKVFDHAEAIQEVSGQASSEASLEAILKKVSTLLNI